jgi:hypothetical protein
MKLHGLLLGLLMVSGPALTQSNALPQVVVHGTVTTSSGDHPAWFTLMCTQGTGGALSVQFMLAADSAPDFPFDAFEGPRAPASFKPSAVLKVENRSFTPLAVGGWFGADMPDAFVFGMASSPGRSATLNQVAAARGKQGATLDWVQQSNNVQTPPIIGHFAPDASQTTALKRMASPCLPRSLRQ